MGVPYVEVSGSDWCWLRWLGFQQLVKVVPNHLISKHKGGQSNSLFTVKLGVLISPQAPCKAEGVDINSLSPQAPCEAEAQCAAMVRAGKVYATATEDMDCLTFGSTIQLRHLTASETK